MDRDAGLDERIDEFGRSQEVGLIRRNDESARVAQFRLAQHLVILHRDAAAHSAERGGVRRGFFRLRSALAALLAISINRGLDFGYAARIDRPIVAAPTFD